MSELLRRIAALSPEKRALLALSNPLSFSQQRLWFLAQMAPESPAYNGTAAARLEGGLDPEALGQALGEIVRRHEALRTIFPAFDGQPLQLVLPARPLPLPLVSLEGLDARGREAAVRRLIEEEARRPFDLVGGPLVRAVLLREDERRHVLLLSMHHIVSDRWSADVLAGELAALYGSYTAGLASALAELPLQYADYARWQQRRLGEGAFDEQLDGWRRRLAGSLPVLELPTDRPRPAEVTYRGARHAFAVPGPLLAALRAQTRPAQATPFMLLLAAFKLLLQRYTGQQDLLVASPVSGRELPQTEELIGFFVNTLVLRTDLSGDPSFAELLKRVRAVCLWAYERQEVPFERLVEELQPERDLSRAPLAQVMFAVQNTPTTGSGLPGLRQHALEVDNRAAKFDLSLSFAERDGGLAGVLEYNTDLFDAHRIARMAGHLGNVLAAAASDPSQRLSALRLLGGGELHQVLTEWNDRRSGPTDAGAVHELIGARAARRPEAVAVVCGDEHLTYRALERRAEGLARRLRRLGVGPESLVGVCAERSAAMLVGLLGVLKAGGAYLPLDPSYPEARLAFMLEDAGVALLVTDRSARRAVSSYAGRVVLLDEGQAAADAGAGQTPEPVPAAGRLAYCIYTSGSTGRPKGVQVTHGALTNFLCAMRRRPGLGERDTLLAVTPLSFDIAALEMFLPLTTGARLVIASREVATDGARLAAELAASGATLMQATPATWRALTEAGWDGSGGLRVLCGGEALSRDLAGRLLEVAGELWNMYGPTETTIWSAVERVRAACATVPLGRPIENTQVYLLDGHGRQVALGTIGELHLGGDGLARGYFNRPGQTAERFVPDPFSAEPGARLYRTGDLARHLPDGRVEFLGRGDQQVKVRGFRIELGEIEAALCEHPSVREAVAVAWEDGAEERRLVAYVVAREGEAAPTTGGLRQALRERLPEYMLPATFILVDALPLTPNGKVNRRALPSPARAGCAPRENYVAPRTRTEAALADIWADLLKLKAVGVHDNFFESGGHSLLCARLVSRVRDLSGVELPLRACFETPTLAGLAERIEAARSGGARSAASPVTRTPRDGAAPLSPAQRRLWFFEQLEPGSDQYNVAIALHLEGRLGLHAFGQSVGAVVSRHEALRTTFADAAGGPVQVVSDALPPGPLVVDLSRLRGAELEAVVESLATAEARRPFDLNRGPLLRASLLRVGAGAHELLLTAHHIVFDGASVEVLTGEVAALYRAFSAGRPSPLTELPVQYVDFVRWQERQLCGRALEPQLAYWKQQLADCPAVLELPTSRPRPAAPTSGGARCHFALPAELSARLRRACHRHGATTFMMLLAALKSLLHRYSGQSDLVLGSPAAGRGRGEVEGLIGLFVNTLVLRTDLSGDPTFAELLGRVREVVLGAFEHQDVPFERLVEELQPERDPGRTPFIQGWFVLHNAALADLPARALIPEVSMTARAVEKSTAMFDLTLSVEESEQGLSGFWEYRTDLFDADAARRMAQHFHVLLDAVAADTSLPLSLLPLLTPAEHHQLLVEWANAAAARRGAACAHELFADAAARTPDAVAVILEPCAAEAESVAGDEAPAPVVLTYGALNRLADGLARRLRAAGVGPEVLVGICTERSAEMLVGLLGVLKAGGAYLPLDPSYPRERLAFMLADTGARVLLAQRQLLPALPAHPQVVCLDEACAEAAAGGPCEAEAAVAPRPDNTAYVIYTSGSTGRPKGVLITHRALVSHNLSVVERYGLGPADRVLQFSSLSFDVAVEEIFPTWVAGGSVVLRAERSVPSPSAFFSFLGRHGVSVVNLPTPYWSELLAAARHRGPGRGLALRLALIGGEKVLPQHFTEATAALGERLRLMNVCGPTETTVTNMAFAAEPGGSWRSGSSVPIGRALANTEVYVFDRRQQPVPAGVAGEVYLGGDCLARGYLNRPELTAERFVPDPFSTRPGARLYRSGDVARFLPDGNVEMLGRGDQQVKLRGFRIELGEVEATLRQHAALREAVALVREVGAGGRRLVAYVVPERGRRAADAELRAYMKGRVPEYMVPSAFVTLDSLPLTSNGKVDRRRLPAPEGLRPEQEVAYAEPRTQAELAVATIWREVLQVERVGADDNFFDLGGHSLLLVRVNGRLKEVFDRDLPMIEMFRHPTVSSLARLLSPEPGGHPSPAAAPHAAPPATRDREGMRRRREVRRQHREESR